MLAVNDLFLSNPTLEQASEQTVVRSCVLFVDVLTTHHSAVLCNGSYLILTRPAFFDIWREIDLPESIPKWRERARPLAVLCYARPLALSCATHVRRGTGINNSNIMFRHKTSDTRGSAVIYGSRADDKTI